MSSYKLSYYMIVDLVKDETSLIKRGENKLNSGHVLSLNFDGSLGVIRGVVKASMRNEKHQVELHLNSESNVSNGSCTCRRGAHPACSHRVALLLHGLKHISPTDSSCSWRAPSGAAKPSTSSVAALFPGKEDYDPTDDPTLHLTLSDVEPGYRSLTNVITAFRDIPIKTLNVCLCLYDEYTSLCTFKLEGMAILISVQSRIILVLGNDAKPDGLTALFCSLLGISCIIPLKKQLMDNIHYSGEDIVYGTFRYTKHVTDHEEGSIQS